jgi:hypothetical protein
VPLQKVKIHLWSDAAADLASGREGCFMFPAQIAFAKKFCAPHATTPVFFYMERKNERTEKKRQRKGIFGKNFRK